MEFSAISHSTQYNLIMKLGLKWISHFLPQASAFAIYSKAQVMFPLSLNKHHTFKMYVGVRHVSIRRMPSSGTLCRVDLVRTHISEELIASIIRVARIDELGITLAVSSNRSTLVHTFLTYAVDRDEWPTSRHDRFTPEKRYSGRCALDGSRSLSGFSGENKNCSFVVLNPVVSIRGTIISSI
jgi:hypothetical protein